MIAESHTLARAHTHLMNTRMRVQTMTHATRTHTHARTQEIVTADA